MHTSTVVRIDHVSWTLYLLSLWVGKSFFFSRKKPHGSEIKGSDSLRSPELGRRETDHVTNFFSLRSGWIACKGSSEKD
jgi:hypothetical protein